MIPTLAPDEAQPAADFFDTPHEDDQPTPRPSRVADELARPFRLGVVGIGVALGLFTRLLVANGFGDLASREMTLAAAATSALAGLGFLLIAAERDRFGAPLAWISAVTALAWGTLNWISPPFDEAVTVFNEADQTVLAVLGVGNGALLAGLISLAFVRRGPTLTVAATMAAGVIVLVANTVALRNEWVAIIGLGFAFALLLVAWDRAPRREQAFDRPDQSPRTSRAALSLASVALSGTAIQLWLSRETIPRAVPAVVLALLLIGAAFASLIRVRREIERRETALSEWRDWLREIRHNDFRAEMANFESLPSTPTAGAGEAPRPLSFPGLIVPDTTDAADPDAAIAGIGAGDLAAAAAELRNAAADPASTGRATDSLLPQADLAGAPPHVVVQPDAATSPTGLPRPDTAAATTTPDTPARPTPPTTPAGLPRPDTATQPTPPTTPAELPRPDTATQPTPPTTPAELPRPDTATQPTPPTTPAELPRPDTTTQPTPPTTPAELPRPDTATQPTPPTTPAELPRHETTTTTTGAPPAIAAGVDALNSWLRNPAAGVRSAPLLVAVEAVSLTTYDALAPADRDSLTPAIVALLADVLPGADLIAAIDGPYFIVAHAEVADTELADLNRDVLARLQASTELATGPIRLDGTLAVLRPAPGVTIEQALDGAVSGLIQARRLEAALATG